MFSYMNIKASDLEEHIIRLSTAKSFSERAGYITSVLDKHNIPYQTQILPNKWQ